MRYLAGTLSILALVVAPEFAHAQARTGRATGTASGSTAGTTRSTGSSVAGAASRAGGRVATTSRGRAADVIRGRTDAVERARSAPASGARTGSIGGVPVGGRTYSIGGGGTTVRVGDSRPSGRTAVRREDSRIGGGGSTPGGSGRGSGVIIVPGSTSGSRAGRASGSVAQTRGSGGVRPSGIGDVRRGDDAVVRGSADGVILGGGRRYDSGWGVRSGPYYGNVGYGRHVVIDPWYQKRIRSCPVTFVFGHHGLTCFHPFAGARFILPLPLFFIYPIGVVHIQSTSVYGASTVVQSGYPVETETPGCAIVTVVLPGNDGYWKTLRLPIENAYTRDQLRRLLSDRMRAGLAFTVVDADGVRLDVPAGLQINEVLVEPCR